MAAALIRAAQHCNVGVVAAHADLDVLTRAKCAERRVDTEPAIGRNVRLDPGVRGGCLPDATEVSADIAGGKADVAAQRDQHVREVLADAAPSGEHLGDGAVHGRGADPVLEASAHMVGCTGKESECARLPILGEQRLGERGRVVFERNVRASAEELGEVVRQHFVSHKRSERR